ncbi:membrane protein [soil metagenome]
MHGPHFDHLDDIGPAKISPAVKVLMAVLGIVGMLAFAYGAFLGPEEGRTNVWVGFFVSSSFFFFLSMGAAIFLAIQYVTGARWFVMLKRIPEAIASFSFQGGFLFPLIALAGTGYIYSWAAPDRDYPLPGTLKATWLSPNVHAVKVLVYIGILTAMTFLLVQISRTPFVRGQYEVLRKKRLRFSILFVIVFGFVFSLYGWDALMSQEPHWFSTMFGVYCFAGAFQSALAVMMLLTFWLKKKNPEYLSEERQVYDVGTYVMCFSVFWMYIAFSQFMLIWYANVPEETFFYMKRGYPPGMLEWEGVPINPMWLIFTAGVPVLKWVIPFFGLMPPNFRTSRLAQGLCCGAILVGQAADLWWIGAPAHVSPSIWPGLLNVLTFMGVFGAFGFTVCNYLTSHAVVPVEGPDALSSVNGDYLHA